MARIRIPGGRLTASAFRAVLSAADELGDGTVELTSRANLQIRGLPPGAEIPLGERLTAAGLLPSLTHERVRNIMASPTGGADIHDLVQALDAALCDRPRLADLPGRFLFTIDDGTGDVAWLTTDIAALLPRPGISPTSPADHTELPNQPTNPPPSHTTAPTASMVPPMSGQSVDSPTNQDTSFTSPANQAGLPPRHRISPASAVVPNQPTNSRPSHATSYSHSADPAALPDQSANSRPSLATSHSHSADPAALPDQPANSAPSHATPYSHSADPAALPDQPANSAPSHATSSAERVVILLGGVDVGLRVAREQVVSVMLRCAERFLALRTKEWRVAELPSGPARIASGFPLVDEVIQPTVGGRRGLGVGAPLGRLTVAQGLALAAAATELVITPWRRVVVDPPPGGAVLEQLASLGLIVDSDAPAVTACVGRPGCAKALADVRADAVAMLPRTSLPVHWSGCARRCGRPRGEVLDMIATETGYVTRQGHE